MIAVSLDKSSVYILYPIAREDAGTAPLHFLPQHPLRKRHVAVLFSIAYFGEMQSIRGRFPAPWRVEETSGGYRVVDKTGFLIAYVYARDDLQQHTRREYLSSGEARAIATAIASLPSLHSDAASLPPTDGNERHRRKTIE